MKDPIEVLSPSDDRPFVALRVEEPRETISSTLLDNLPMDDSHSPTIDVFVLGGQLDRHIAGSTHVVNC